MQTMKFVREEPGFCRVMYRGSEDRVLYALQDDSPLGLDMYECTKDGEPSWSVAMPIKSRFDKFIDPRRKPHVR